MLLINGQRITESNTREFGRVQCPMYFQMENRLLGNVGLGFGALASVPVAHGMTGILPCITAGSMSSRAINFLTVSGAAPINKGISIAASGAAITFDGAAPLAALVNMAASGPIVFGGSAGIYGVAFMDATGGITFSGSAGLGGLFSISASGDLTFGGSAVTHSLAFLETTENTGTMTEATITAAVWSALASAYNVPGTMGEKLNGAGSAGNPWTEIIESGMSAADILRVLLSVLAGETTIDDQGGGIAVVEFANVAGTKSRVTADMDGSERTSITLDGTL